MTGSRSSRILIADGSPVELQALSERLAEAGFTVDQATCAAEIFAKVAQLFYDVVVTDLNMPEIDGLALLTQLAEHSPDTAVIILTGHGSIESAVEAMKKGAFDYFSKPADPETLVLAIQRAQEFMTFKAENVFKEYMGYARILSRHIADTDITINTAVAKKKNVLLEGAQGTLLDIDHGTYPFVTSSSAIAGGACTGLGIGPTKIDTVLGIVKAYTTRVGSGPFPTELHDKTGELIREKGGEFGATTGRARRCGWLDTVILKHSCRVNGLSGIVLTKLDILDGMDTLKICTAYSYRGKILQEMPKELSVIEKCVPVYEEVKGWKGSTLGIRDFRKLPRKAQSYIRRIEALIGVKVSIVSTGQKRDELILLQEPF